MQIIFVHVKIKCNVFPGRRSYANRVKLSLVCGVRVFGLPRILESSCIRFCSNSNRPAIRRSRCPLLVLASALYGSRSSRVAAQRGICKSYKHTIERHTAGISSEQLHSQMCFDNYYFAIYHISGRNIMRYKYYMICFDICIQSL